MRSLARHRRPGSVALTTVTALAALAAGSVVALAGPATAQARPAAGAAQKWTKISAGTALSIASAGLLRTPDGRLHVVWPSNDGSAGYSLHYSTVGGRARLVSTGTIVRKWAGIGQYPRLMAGPGGGIRLAFPGGSGQSGSPLNLGAMHTATASSAGTSWTVSSGSISHSVSVPLTDDAGVAEADGTPVTAWATGTEMEYHVGLSPVTPASAGDQQIAVGQGGPESPALTRDHDGSVWLAWYTSSGQANQGYYVDQILPARKASRKAPGSGGKNLADNQPLQPAALAARVGSGEYLAYCVASKTALCSHIALWKVGAARAATVPGSGTGSASHVAIAAGPGGHLWVLWYDGGLNKIRVVRTNATVTRFGQVATLAGPPSLGQLDGLQAEGSQGPLDVVGLVQQNTGNGSPAYWDTQVLPSLRLSGSPAKVSHQHAATITFKATDAGDPVPGVTITLLGQKATTNGSGIARITVPKGSAKGSHPAAASKPGYAGARITIKVT